MIGTYSDITARDFYDVQVYELTLWSKVMCLSCDSRVCGQKSCVCHVISGGVVQSHVTCDSRGCGPKSCLSCDSRGCGPKSCVCHEIPGGVVQSHVFVCKK